MNIYFLSLSGVRQGFIMQTLYLLRSFVTIVVRITNSFIVFQNDLSRLFGGEIFSSIVNCTIGVYHKTDFHNWENTCGLKTISINYLYLYTKREIINNSTITDLSRCFLVLFKVHKTV